MFETDLRGRLDAPVRRVRKHGAIFGQIVAVYAATVARAPKLGSLLACAGTVTYRQWVDMTLVTLLYVSGISATDSRS